MDYCLQALLLGIFILYYHCLRVSTLFQKTFTILHF
uniref:Uncharacterized protein n=1 Tax=Siphoviridae sp. cteLh2 TaxID=2825590 RepID=A0A8S5U5Y5_9CAUD|nr:MAG TPA: hypothetical protein [Siphoviridae sp. cteLh2]